MINDACGNRFSTVHPVKVLPIWHCSQPMNQLHLKLLKAGIAFSVNEFTTTVIKEVKNELDC